MSKKRKQKVTVQSEQSAEKELQEFRGKRQRFIRDDSEADPNSITIDVGGLIVVGVGILCIILFGLKMLRVW